MVEATPSTLTRWSWRDFRVIVEAARLLTPRYTHPLTTLTPPDRSLEHMDDWDAIPTVVPSKDPPLWGPEDERMGDRAESEILLWMAGVLLHDELGVVMAKSG